MLIVRAVYVAGGHRGGAYRYVQSFSVIGTEMYMSVVISRILLNKALVPPKPPHSSHPAEHTHISVACAWNFQCSSQSKISTERFSVIACVYLQCFSTLMKF